MLQADEEDMVTATDIHLPALAHQQEGNASSHVPDGLVISWALSSLCFVLWSLTEEVLQKFFLPLAWWASPACSLPLLVIHELTHANAWNRAWQLISLSKC